MTPPPPELFAGAVSGWNCPMVKSVVGTVVHLLHGVDVLGMITVEEVLHLAAGTYDRHKTYIDFDSIIIWHNNFFEKHINYEYQIVKY